MSRKGVNFSIRELDSDIARFRDISISIGAIHRDTWNEKIGPTPFPSLSALRSWDHTLLARYKPFYMPFCDLC
ncbi:hypothetical protein, partial [Methanoregula sp. PtaB.Bin085]